MSLILRIGCFLRDAGGGGTAVLAVYPDDGVVVAVMANLGQAKQPFRPFINVVPSDVTPSGILISPQWAWEDLNFRPHAYQAFPC